MRALQARTRFRRAMLHLLTLLSKLGAGRGAAAESQRSLDLIAKHVRSATPLPRRASCLFLPPRCLILSEHTIVPRPSAAGPFPPFAAAPNRRRRPEQSWPSYAAALTWRTAGGRRPKPRLQSIPRRWPPRPPPAWGARRRRGRPGRRRGPRWGRHRPPPPPPRGRKPPPRGSQPRRLALTCRSTGGPWRRRCPAPSCCRRAAVRSRISRRAPRAPLCDLPLATEYPSLTQLRPPSPPTPPSSTQALLAQVERLVALPAAATLREVLLFVDDFNAAVPSPGPSVLARSAVCLLLRDGACAAAGAPLKQARAVAPQPSLIFFCRARRLLHKRALKSETKLNSAKTFGRKQLVAAAVAPHDPAALLDSPVLSSGAFLTGATEAVQARARSLGRSVLHLP